MFFFFGGGGGMVYVARAGVVRHSPNSRLVVHRPWLRGKAKNFSGNRRNCRKDFEAREPGSDVPANS